MVPSRRLLSIMLLVVSALASRTLLGADASQVVPAEGAPFVGQFAGADASWKLRFVEGETPREIAAGDLVMWGTFAEPPRGTQIVLPGGGVIVVDSVRIGKEALQGQSQIFGAFSLPLELVAGVVLRPPLGLAKADQLLFRVAASGLQADRIVLDNGDELSGTIASLSDTVLVLENDAGKMDVDVAQITAIVFNPTLVKPLPSRGVRAMVGFRDGSRFVASGITADKTSALLELPGGAKLNSATGAIVALQPFGGRVDYLSDLKPASYRHVPYLQLSWPFYADRSTLGGQLRSGGKVYPKGLGMHSPSRITFDLARGYRQFQAELAVDDEADGRGSVVFRVFTDDGSGSWQERATSEIVRGGDPAVPLTVDLTGAKRISLLVDHADRGDELDHADWLNARLVR